VRSSGAFTKTREQPMKVSRILKVAKLAVSGSILLQVAGCDIFSILDFVQTGLLAVTAAGAVAILQNI
jgi:hypothetical protein